MNAGQAATPDTLPDAAAWWDARYRSGDSPWDTGIVPPELEELVSSGQLEAGWALDLGCGSGASSQYLSQHGFRVVGIDLAQSALVRARRSAAVGALPVLFCRGDASDLAFLRLGAAFALDVGCFHSVSPERRRTYIASLARCLLPGAFYLLYAFELYQRPGDERPRGVDPAGVAGFAPQFVLRWAQHGRDAERPSAWYLFRRAA